MAKRKVRITVKRIERLMEDNCGLCVECGHEQGCVEPDARDYTCESCGKPAVQGAEELVFPLDF